MPSAFSHRLNYASAVTLDQQWDPQRLLGIVWVGRCIGKASTTHDGTCSNPINKKNRALFVSLIAKLSSRPLDADRLQPELQMLARLGLCLRNHQNQREDLVRQWTDKIDAVTIRIMQLHARSLESTRDTRSTTASSATARSLITSSSRSRLPSPSTASSRFLPAEAEIESLNRSIMATEATLETARRRRDQLQAPHTPRIEPARLLARTSTAGMSSIHLSDGSSVASSHTVRTRSSATSSRSVSPARSTSSQSTMSSSSDSHAPSSPPTQADRPGHTTAATGSTSTAASSPDSDRSASLQQSPNIAGSNNAPTPRVSTPDLPSSTTPPHPPAQLPRQCTTPHVRRIPLADECPICYEGGALSTLPARELIWCTSSCGRTVHKTCFDNWAAQCSSSNRALDCPVCRAEWSGSCACGGRSTCERVHAERRDRGACPVCREELGRDGQEDSAVDWCKDGCGQNVHSECMQTWIAQCSASGRVARCVMCRAEWRSGCAC